ncbi:unnamed protein product [Candidula unifasciata]|uniref:C-type lectin domain-containing protein n=1 Tax=Candidula unifasciata TaxID=100452 RepID=A0A8S3ZB67_9EUPU|nr:unnamed protein product [Candidula unifasciata]
MCVHCLYVLTCVVATTVYVQSLYVLTGVVATTVCVQCLYVQDCRKGWQYFGESCYGFGASRTVWGAAQAICKVYNGKLAEIETFEENEFLKNLAKSKQADRVFLGGTDIFGEGNWEWSSSGKHIFPFVDWVPGEPNDSSGQDCLILDRQNEYSWDDYSCNMAVYFICEAKSTEIVG